MGGNNNNFVYGYLENHNVDTDGMEPKEAWEEYKDMQQSGDNQEESTDDNSIKPTKESIHEKARKIAHNVNITSESYEALDTALNAIQKLVDQYGIDKLRCIETVDVIPYFGPNNPAAIIDGGLYISNNFLKNPSRLYDITNKIWRKNAEQKYQQARMLFDSAEDCDIETKQQLTNDLLDASFAVKFDKQSFCCPGYEIQCVINHEIGHVLLNRALKIDPNKHNTLNHHYVRAIHYGEVFHLSQRSVDGPNEYYAEAFSYYHFLKQNGKEIPNRIIKVVEEIL